MAKNISFNLSTQSVENAIKELKDYKKTLPYKCEMFCRALIELGNITATASIEESPLSSYIVVNTSISPETMGCKGLLTSIGQSVTNQYGTVNYLMLVEFGAGIYFNPVDNPLASKYGMGVGTFPNQTHAFEDGWYYPDDKGIWHFTNGTKATMPMYNADTQMTLMKLKLAKEVFKRY
jgi:hypothetical protein